MNQVLKFTLAAVLVLVMSAMAGADTFLVTMDTTHLETSLGTPVFWFELFNNNSAPNSAALTAFDFGGGNAIAGTDDCTFFGLSSAVGCSGNLTSGVTLNDANSGSPIFVQQFVPGSSLSFYLTTTNNFVPEPSAPDQLKMYMAYLEANSNGNSLTVYPALQLYLAGTLSPSSFNLSAYDSHGSMPVVTTAEATVPEPASLALLGIGLVGVAARKRKRLVRTGLLGLEAITPD